MPDVIRLLPDSIANQIAAGEVIQRPSSAVKELMENAIDAGATTIHLIIKDAGRALVQVIDDGAGMSPTDARMAYERHATSKIQQIDDLFSLKTMGFRGEALASIAAVAQVELRTRRADDEVGTLLRVEGSKILVQEPCSAPQGTSISMKNLFFNVPARRQFLKSNPVETRHILDEFTRIAMAYPRIAFTLKNNGVEIFHLRSGNFRQRVVGIFGKNYNEKLVPVEERTDYISVYGLIGKPEIAKKTRGEQFFFVNGRFVRSNFFNHAVTSAYHQLISDKSFPFYAIFIDIDPGRIDINVHPTKQEVKFDDERSVYAIVSAATKRGLGKYSVTPTIDFEQEASFKDFAGGSASSPPPRQPSEGHSYGGHYTPSSRLSSTPGEWEQLYKVSPGPEANFLTITSNWATPASGSYQTGGLEIDKEETSPVQVHQRYILSQIKSGVMVVDQQKAHERILYERYLTALSQQPVASQQTLFPQTIQLHAADAAILEEIQPELRALGFDIQSLGHHSFVIHGIPADFQAGDEKVLVEEVLEQYKNSEGTEAPERRLRVARSLAIRSAIKPGKLLSVKEMKSLIDELFACEQPHLSPSGKNTLVTFSLEELEKRFS
jgi:DNA mismatch repair protein MutL